MALAHLWVGGSSRELTPSNVRRNILCGGVADYLFSLSERDSLLISPTITSLPRY